MSKALEKISLIPQDDAPASMPIPHIPPTQTLINVLARMMSDPSVDIERIERGAMLYERAVTRDAEIAFNDAMMKAQAEMRPIQADASNPQTRSRYATYHALDAKARPIYSKYFSLSFDTAEGAPEGCIRVVAFVAVGGFTRTYHVDMPCDGKGAKGNDVMTKTHATGAGITYGRRYLLGMIFNLVIGEDRDGNDADASYVETGELISDEQIKTLIDLCDRTSSDKAKFCQKMKVDSLAAIPVSSYQRAVDVLKHNAKIKGIAL